MKKRMNLTNMLRGWTYRHLTRMGYDDSWSPDKDIIPLKQKLTEFIVTKSALQYKIDTEDI